MRDSLLENSFQDFENGPSAFWIGLSRAWDLEYYKEAFRNPRGGISKSTQSPSQSWDRQLKGSRRKVVKQLMRYLVCVCEILGRTTLNVEP